MNNSFHNLFQSINCKMSLVVPIVINSLEISYVLITLFQRLYDLFYEKETLVLCWVEKYFLSNNCGSWHVLCVMY